MTRAQNSKGLRSLSATQGLKGLAVGPKDPITAAIAAIDQNLTGSALVLNRKGMLLDVVTDGDIRRALLSGTRLTSPVSHLRDRRSTSLYPKPVTAPWTAKPAFLRRLMQDKQVRQVPLLDRHGRVVRLALLRDFLPEQEQPLQAVVMAGGFGKRLSQLTKKKPKPMLPVGRRPLLERILRRLKDAGIHRVHVTTHYRPEAITRYVGNGGRWGLDVNYLSEYRPQGTAGSLRRLKGPGPFLVINGDILTQVDFQAFLRFHQEMSPILTVGVRRHETAIPFGVMHLDGPRVTGISEKPVLHNYINAGIYLLNAEALSFIPKGRRFDMPDLIRVLLQARRKVVGFPIHEPWIDIGTPRDYQEAKDSMNRSKGAGRGSSS